MLDLLEERFKAALAVRKEANELARENLKELAAILIMLKDRRFKLMEKIAAARDEYRILLVEEKAEARLQDARASIRALWMKALELGKDIAEIQVIISRLSYSGAETFYLELEAFKRDLELSGIHGTLPTIG